MLQEYLPRISFCTASYFGQVNKDVDLAIKRTIFFLGLPKNVFSKKTRKIHSGLFIYALFSTVLKKSPIRDCKAILCLIVAFMHIQYSVEENIIS